MWLRRVLTLGASRRLRRADLARLVESEQRYKSLFDHNPDAVYSFDVEGRFTSLNGVGRQLLGRDDVIGDSFAEVVHPDDLPRVAAHFEGAVAGEPQKYECRVVSDRGELIHLEVANSAIVVHGVVVGVFGVAKDVSERVAIERRLSLSKQRYKALYDRNPDAVYSLGLDGAFVSGNEACLQLTGYEPRALAQVSFDRLIVPEDLEHVAAQFLRAVGGESVHYECRMLRADGEVIHVRVQNIPIVVDGAVVGVYGLAKDVTDHHRLQEELRRQARSDALTGLPNRLELHERLDERLAAGDAWVLFVDLDRFKVVNDSLGHEVGDALLCVVAGRLRAALRDGDVLVRLGGDEFCAVLAQGVTRWQAQEIAERLSAAVRPPVVIGAEEFYVTASVGVSRGGRGERADELLRRADIAMYEAKSEGRDRVASYRAGASEAARSQLSVETELRWALQREELVLHHQPQLRLCAGGDVVVGTEALVRWQHPTRGLLLPQAFLPALQTAGLTVALDRWVVESAVRAAAQRPGGEQLTVSVNVSPESLLADCWLVAVEQVLSDTGLPPRALTIEITEQTVLGDPDRVRHVLQRLRDRGVRIALDDFGTGWSSLGYLESYPVDILKIDRLFVARLDAAPHAPVVDAVLSLARALALHTVAEGVETPLQRDRLLAAGCDAFQGHLVSRAVPEDELVALLAARALPVPAPGPGDDAVLALA